MVYTWEPGTQYDAGTVVEFQGHRYKIIQPHQSQSGWEPTATPALWARLPEEAHGEHHHEEHRHDSCGDNNQQYHQQQPQYPGSQQAPQSQGEKPWINPSDQKVDIPDEERKHGWDSLSDERKDQIKIGGGLLAGIAAIGAGYFAYKEHEKNEEEKNANLWGLQNWLHDAEKRTDEFRRNGPRGPVTWVLVSGHNVPRDALSGGVEDGVTQHICRAYHEGGIQIGKAGNHFEKGGVIGYGHKEIQIPMFEVLLGDPRAVKWVDCRGRLDLGRLGARPVEGGREADGTPLYVAQASYKHVVIPGKCSTKLDAAFIPYGYTEKEVKEYRVLCYA